MLTTSGFTNFNIEMDGTLGDSTVMFLSGAARFGSTINVWDGTATQHKNLCNFSSVPEGSNYCPNEEDSGFFQNVLIYLWKSSSSFGTDMTFAQSELSRSRASLPVPFMVSDGYPLSLFTYKGGPNSDSTLIAFTH